MSERPSQRLASEKPGVYALLKALKGDSKTLDRLEQERAGLYAFAQAFSGDMEALHRLHSDETLELGDLLETIHDDRLSPWLDRQYPVLHRLFEAVKGDPDALQRVKGARKKQSLIQLAQVLGDLYARHLYKEAGRDEFSSDAAADMGCLVGDLHLKQGDYQKAIEAFSRAIATNPTIDAYEGRARAHRALAIQDERKAQELRGEP
jgi:tetratricopeptide (TPR) repeat protein